MARRRYLISYDVADDKRRNQIFQTLEDHGDHAQFSVFFCELNAAELAVLRGQLSEIAHQRRDQVLILDLGDAQHPLDERLECIGMPYQPRTRSVVV